MFILANGNLVEDEVVTQFNHMWTIYESCKKIDDNFIQLVTSTGIDLERANELLVLLKTAREFI